MSEERLKEIKDSLNMSALMEFADKSNIETFLYKYINEEIELYNEVVRLREIYNKALEWFKYADRNSLDKLYNILKQNNLTLEQLNGIENE